MKYIILETKADPMPVLVIGFSPLSHVLIADSFLRVGCVPVSAGFARFTPAGAIETFGRSVSLNLSPKPDDGKLLTAFYNSTLKTATL